MSDTSGPPDGRCATADIDLDALAAAYRHRPISGAGRRHALQAVEGLDSGIWALDVGGGPGAHAEIWADLGHRAVVLDPGRAMLEIADRRRDVVAVQGRAQRMPFRSATFAAAFFHLSIHYGDWRASLDETRRVLAPGGRVWIWTLGPDHHASSMLARWFPSVPQLDRDRFPDPADVEAHLAKHAAVQRGSELEIKRRRAGDWVRAVEAGFVSTLQLVPAGELDSGLAAFRRAYPDPDATVQYTMRWTWIVARV